MIKSRAVRRASLFALSTLALGTLPGAPAAAGSSTRLEVELVSTGSDADASGDARLRTRAGRTDFRVQVEDLDPARYDLVVGGVVRAVLDVVAVAPGATAAEVQFASPAERGKLPLGFDPSGQLASVERAGTVYLHVVIPSASSARRRGADDGPGDVRREDRQQNRREDRRQNRREDRARTDAVGRGRAGPPAPCPPCASDFLHAPPDELLNEGV